MPLLTYVRFRKKKDKKIEERDIPLLYANIDTTTCGYFNVVNNQIFMLIINFLFPTSNLLFNFIELFTI